MPSDDDLAPPNDLERFLLADAHECWPDVLPLARLLVLAPRIEPLLLRNARHRYLPALGAELESKLWFSPLVAARSTREIVLHLGIARVMAGRLGGAETCPSGGGWSARSLGDPEALPPWLADRLPPPLAEARLAVEVRAHDGETPTAEVCSRNHSSSAALRSSTFAKPG